MASLTGRDHSLYPPVRVPLPSPVLYPWRRAGSSICCAAFPHQSAASAARAMHPYSRPIVRSGSFAASLNRSCAPIRMHGTYGGQLISKISAGALYRFNKPFFRTMLKYAPGERKLAGLPVIFTLKFAGSDKD